jgi:S1-C subfamily serine protease
MKRAAIVVCLALTTLMGCFGSTKPSQTTVAKSNKVEQMIKSVPLVVCSTGVGAGVLFKTDGRVGMLTAAHVIQDECSPEEVPTYGTERIGIIGYHPGTEIVSYITTATLVAIDPKNDWALLAVESEYPAMDFSVFADRLPIIGEDVWCIGSPLLDGGTISKGIVCHPDRTPAASSDNSLKFIHTDAAGAVGSSGGGLFDTDGVCIGIVVRKNLANNTMYAFSTYYIHEQMHGMSLTPEPFPLFK